MIWKGLGFLVIVIPAAIYALSMMLLGSESEVLYYWSSVVSGVVIWIVGKRLNSNKKDIVIDPETGEYLKDLREQHTFFFVPMRYWGIIFFVFGIIYLVA